MTRAKELERHFLEYVGRHLSAFDFAHKPLTGRWFVRPTKTGRCGIHLSVQQYDDVEGPFIDLFPSVGVRLDAVEDVLNLARPWLNEHERALTWTVGIPFFSVSSEYPFKIDVRSPAEFPDASTLVSTGWRELGEAFVERFSDFDRARDEFVNGAPHAFTGGVTQTLQAAIAACRASGTAMADIQALVERKKEELDGHPNWSQKVIDDLLKAIAEPSLATKARVGSGASSARRASGLVRKSKEVGSEWGRDPGPRRTVEIEVDVDLETRDAVVRDEQLDKPRDKRN